ncbi:MlaD family protein [Algibacter pectinivorans]|uniref:Phospholipid/cholesterol/gamma-HCH transport system substrate-binding protein n=1 Tax=Algibacter pectinivorans TaxID=870482 RepID=A0A1I1RPZ8_9FLAO|nr:MlaD family protein [Algibacter pectinivorans]SFD34338.1 phospholipid/cholesterol/gamma-HCH transport system substrate-binding protein [Algibacter pectinivorans]
MKITREVKTGVLVLLGIILLYYGFNYLKGRDLFNSSLTFYTEYDNVEGLVPSTPVTINGLAVGQVTKIGFKGDGSGKLLIELIVDSDFKFSKNSKAELYETGLIGGKAVAIVPAFDGAEQAKNGAVLKGSIKAGLTELVNQRLTPLQEKIEIMMVGADSLLNNINDIFDEKTKAHLQTSIAGLSSTIDSFKSTSNSLNQLMIANEAKIDAVLTNAEKATSDLTKISGSLSQSDLGQTVKNLESTLANFNTLLADLEQGKGTMGKLLKDDQLYNNLEGATSELEALLLDFKLHPNRYTRILSKKEIPYQEPESN